MTLAFTSVQFLALLLLLLLLFPLCTFWCSESVRDGIKSTEYCLIGEPYDGKSSG